MAQYFKNIQQLKEAWPMAVRDFERHRRLTCVPEDLVVQLTQNNVLVSENHEHIECSISICFLDNLLLDANICIG